MEIHLGLYPRKSLIFSINYFLKERKEGKGGREGERKRGKKEGGKEGRKERRKEGRVGHSGPNL
jgi:hypothetical protein